MVCKKYATELSRKNPQHKIQYPSRIIPSFRQKFNNFRNFKIKLKTQVTAQYIVIKILK